jgi:hypothetical protein
MKTSRIIIFLSFVAHAIGGEATAPAFSTNFDETHFTSPHELNLSLRNWFEFAAMHAEDGGRGSGEGGAAARIVETDAHSGQRSLLLELFDIEKSRRSEFNLWPPEEIADEFSASFWLKFPVDFGLHAPDIDWNWMEFCVLASEEIATNGGTRWDYLRLMLHLPDSAKPEFAISLGGRRGAERKQFSLGRAENFALPRGRWFNVHYCIERHPEHGRVKVWVDGNLLFDFQKIPTTEAGAPCRISPAKIYHETTDKSPKKLFVDAVTIWPGWVEPEFPLVEKQSQ